MNPTRRIAVLAAVSLCIAVPALAQKEQPTIKVAYIDPLSGAFANVGEQGLAEFRFSVDHINKRGGVLGGRKLEIVPFDNKVSPQESMNQLKRVIDQDIRFITQGNSS